MPGGKQHHHKPRYRHASRDLVAFQYLMEDEDAASTSAASTKSKRPSGGNRREGRQGFKLRDTGNDAAASRAETGAVGAVPALLEMFPQLDRAIVEEVGAQFPHSVERAAEALLALNLDGASSSAASPAAVGGATHSPPQGAARGEERTLPNLWDMLPAECKRLVLQRLTLRDVARAARACRELAQYADDLLSAKTTVNIPSGLSTAQISGMCRAHKNLKAVSLRSCGWQFQHEWDYQRLMQALANGTHGRLQSIDLRGLQLSDHDIPMLLSILPCLKSLKLDDCQNLTDQTLKLLSQHKPASPENFFTVPASQNSPYAVGDDVGWVTFGVAEQTNRGVVKRHFSEIRNQVRDAAMDPPQRPAAPPSGMESISMQGLPEVTDEGLRLLFKSRSSSRSMTQLDVSRCPRISGMCLSLISETALRTLKAGKCAGLKVLELRLTGASSLTELSIPGCNNLKSLEVIAPSLRTLNTSSCKSLETVACSGACIEKLLMSMCPRLLDFNLRIECPSVTTINISQCHSITSAGLDRFVGSATKLRNLNINGCVSVGSVLLMGHTELEALDMAGCRSAATLRNNSYKLRHLYASGCSSLKAVELSSTGMETISLENSGLHPERIQSLLQLRSRNS